MVLLYQRISVSDVTQITSRVEFPRSDTTVSMNAAEFRQSLQQREPSAQLPPALAALWWDARGDWARAHSLVDELETPEGMAVHAYLHRKEGAGWNADYWYNRAGRRFYRPSLGDEWEALLEGLSESG